MANTVTEVAVVQGVSQKSGKPFTKYNVTLDDGRTASGFTYTKVGDQVVVQQQGAFLNFTPAGAAPRSFSGAPAAPPPVANGLDRSSRIERQHSQEMAIRYMELKGLNNLTFPEIITLIDWFQRDVGRVPAPPKPKAAEPEPQELIDAEILQDIGGSENGEPF